MLELRRELGDRVCECEEDYVRARVELTALVELRRELGDRRGEATAINARRDLK